MGIATGREPSPLAVDAARHHVPEPGLDFADVSVLVGGRPPDRLAPGATSARSRRGGAGLVMQEATAVTAEGRISPRTPASGPTRRPRTTADRRLHPLPGRGPRHPARARRPQGVTRSGPGTGRGLVPPADGGWVPPAPTTDAVPGLAAPAALSTADVAGARRGLAGRRAPGRRRRLRGRRDPRRARLPAAPVPVSADEHPHRRVRRLARQPGPAAHRGRGRGPGGLAGATSRCWSGSPPATGRRAGSDRRRRRRGRRGPGRARRRPLRPLQRRHWSRTRRSSSGPATRCRSPAPCTSRPGCRPRRSG